MNKTEVGFKITRPYMTGQQLMVSPPLRGNKMRGPDKGKEVDMPFVKVVLDDGTWKVVVTSATDGVEIHGVIPINLFEKKYHLTPASEITEDDLRPLIGKTVKVVRTNGDAATGQLDSVGNGLAYFYDLPKKPGCGFNLPLYEIETASEVSIGGPPS